MNLERLARVKREDAEPEIRHLISNLLDLTRIQEGMKLERQMITVSKLIQESLKDFEMQAQTRRITMHMDLPTGDFKVSVDPLRMSQVIQDVLHPRGVGVVIEGAHECMTTRGVHKRGVSMITSKMLGSFREDARTRAEFLQFIDVGPGR